MPMPTLARTPSRRARPVAALVASALLLGACQVAAELRPTTWTMSSTNDVAGPHTITVTDQSGRVAEVGFDPPDADLFGGVTVPAIAPNALDVTWTGGSCDAATDIVITTRGAGLGVEVTVTGDGNMCDAMGIPRAIRLVLNQPVAPATVEVTQASGDA